MHGPTVQGVDWGSDEARLELRYEKMAALIESSNAAAPSLLDAGCGFGGFFAYLTRSNIAVEYSGIDVVPTMIDHASREFPDALFSCADLFDLDPADQFDYVVCNGILTQKLTATKPEMDAFSERLIKAMFKLCRVGIAFNVMSTRANFMVDNLYYRDPVDMLAWCLDAITPRLRIDHLYPPLYEFTVYLYRADGDRTP